MKKRIGVRLTSLGIAALIAVSGPFTVKAHAEDYNQNNTYSYNISYVKDESGIIFDDNYTEELMNQYRMAPDSQVIEIPEQFNYDVRRSIGNISEDEEITVGHLRKITRLFLTTSYDDLDMSWINYCTNVEDLFITGAIANNLDEVIGLEHVKTVSLGVPVDRKLHLEQCSFLKHCPEIENLYIGGQFDPEYLYQLDNVKGMDLNMFYNRNIDYKRLDFLDSLTLNGGAYDIAIHLSNEDIAYLEGKGVTITKGGFDDTTMEDVKHINEELDQIIKSLNLSPNATEEEKINAVLIYCLENLEYDSEVSDLLDAGRRNEIDHDHFYHGGDLYGALELDSQICGNYAALMDALLYRVGVNSYVLSSETHGWNLVEVDGEYYFVDATWLDSQNVVVYTETKETTPDGYSITLTPEKHKAEDIISSNDELMDQLDWYRVNPYDYKMNPDSFEQGRSFGSHQAGDFPISIVEVTNNGESDATTVQPVSDSTNTNSTANNDDNPTEKKAEKSFGERLFDVTIGNKTFRITGAVLVAIMSSLGIAISVRKKKEQERLRKRRQQQYFSYGNDPYSSGSTSYDWGTSTYDSFNDNSKRKY